MSQDTQVNNQEKAALLVPARPEIKPGLYRDLSNDDYHRGPGISKSGLDHVARSPKHYRHYRDNPTPQTDPMRVGEAIHTIILEPDKFDAQFVKSEYQEFRTKAAKEWRDNQILAGRHILRVNDRSDPFKVSEWDYVHAVRDAVRSDPFASILLNLDDGIPEESAFWIDQETRKLCKCRPDFRNLAHGVAVDLKSTEDASFTGFGKSIANYRYHVQSAFYSDGLAACGAPVSAFVFVAVEKAPPYAVACYVVDDEALRVARAMYRENLRVYAECKARGEWPGYPGNTIFEPAIRTIEIPPWGIRGRVS